ncbi:hypothetical protein PMAYCL1PPCAC_05059 [Pristionchus mayeri]|uniref:Uncharacterized protein n=1 Tax=Pristionchus mayeri TaxID=1317129 RepID=A0AAN5CAH6_9BILA|nr:hypothetical protein PMAYCL1PPCAC_05059 [Pristionchus mayeri]
MKKMIDNFLLLQQMTNYAPHSVNNPNCTVFIADPVYRIIPHPLPAGSLTSVRGERIQPDARASSSCFRENFQRSYKGGHACLPSSNRIGRVVRERERDKDGVEEDREWETEREEERNREGENEDGRE